ncbi:MAG: carboxypeptidase regulatory-like domain-containing protein [Acidobacteria bacterium]|nr:carboxypeptidase regulatory-like domain-containing protein [Acidobacteriota bacterium]
MSNLFGNSRHLAALFLFALFLSATAIMWQTTSHAQKFELAGDEYSRVMIDDLAPEAGTISGRVYQDFNGNGAYDTTAGLNSIDVGVAGVTVSAFDQNGVARGSTTSAANGTFSLAATGTGPYRIEFTTLPAGHTPSARSTDSVLGGSATDSGSTVQFVNDLNTSNVNLALTRAEDYCQNNPTVVVSRYAQGASNGQYSANAVLYDFPYNAGTTYTDTTIANYDNPLTHSLTTTAATVGTIYSISYNSSTNRIYAASYFKKHSGFGPGADGTLNTSDDPGAIYVINPATSAVTATFTLPNATTNNHDVLDYGADNGDTGWNGVGKSGIGGMDIADDNSRLFVMNLQDRSLYALNPTTGASFGNSVSVTTLTLPTPAGSATNCSTGSGNTNKRPFAVKYYRGSVYIGVLCTAETNQNAANLYAYVFQVDPATLAITSTPVFSTQLNYSRGFADPGEAAEWRPWVTTIQANFAYPQPMFTSIEFENGNLIMGIRDRTGDSSLDAGPDDKRTAGDTLRACGTFGSWTLESNGRCGGTGSAPQNTGQGPGNGEFYHNDDFCLTPNGANYHDEVTWGSLMYLPGRQHVVTTLLDPISRIIDNGATFDGGLRYFNNNTGNAERAYRIYNGLGGVGQPDFGKANGLGTMSALCSAAPIEIGNRVWRDNNNNGVQDPGEPGIAGVQVRLFNASNVVVGTAVTDANGEYYFVGSTAADGNTGDNIGQVNGGIGFSTAYQIRFDRIADYLTGGPLNGLTLTAANVTSQLGDDDSSDSDAAQVINPTGSPNGNFPVINVTTGGPGSNNHTFDTGFYIPASASGVYVSGRVSLAAGNGIRNVQVALVEADGTLHVTKTGSFGYYRFEDIPAGQTVIVSVAAKRYTFNPSTRIVSLNEDLADYDWVSDE